MHRMAKSSQDATSKTFTFVPTQDFSRPWTDAELHAKYGLTDEEIAYYVDAYQPFDKAGAYGIQEWIGFVGVTRIEGSYFNVMGLPIQRLYTELKKEFLWKP